MTKILRFTLLLVLCNPVFGARLPIVGIDTHNWGTLLNTWLLVDHTEDGMHKTMPLSVLTYGAVGDGVTDDTEAFQDAITAAGTEGYVYIPKTGSGYVITGTLNIALPMHIRSDGATVYMYFATAESDKTMFNVTASSVTIAGIIFDGSKMATSGHGAVRNVIKAVGGDGTELSNVHVRNCEFHNMNAAGVGTSSVNHCVFYSYTDKSTVQDCLVNSCSGAAIFVDFSDQVRVLRNDVNDTKWYSISFYRDCTNFEIAHNHITGTHADARDKGGSISLMSLQGDGVAPDKRGRVHHNYMSGIHNYGGALGVRSCSNIDIDGNIFENITHASEENKTCIRIQTRGSSGTNNGPCTNINIRGNIMIAGDVAQRAIYMDNDGNGAPVAVAENFVISGNQAITLDVNNYFSSFLMVHGQEGGFDNVVVTDNVARGIPDDSPVQIPGLIGLFAVTSAHNTNFIISNNILTFEGTADDAVENGIYVGPYCDDILITGNIVDGFYNAVEAGTNHGIVALKGNKFYNSVSTNLLWVTLNNILGEQDTAFIGTIAAAVDDEVPLWGADEPAIILSVSVINDGNIPQNDTDYETFTIKDKGSSGIGTSVLMTANTKATGGIFVRDFDMVSLGGGNVAYRELAVRDVISFDKTHSGAGQGITNMRAVIKYVTY